MQNVHQPGTSGNAEVSGPGGGRITDPKNVGQNPLAKRLENGYKAIPVEGNVWRGSSVGQSMRLISAVSGVQFPPSLPSVS